MTEPSIVVPEHDFYDAARRRIEHEDTLNVNRLPWLMASQSFLFSAIGVIGGIVALRRLRKMVESNIANDSRPPHWSVTYALAGSGRSDGASAGFHCGVDDTLPAALA